MSVFISSTSLDLQAHRAAVRRACDELGLGICDMRDFEAADLDAVRASLAQLDRARVYVGVFAHRYGFVMPGETRSVTECEFDRAAELGLERLCFLIDDKHDWPRSRTHRQQPQLVRALHQKVQSAGLVVARFTTPEQLQHAVYRALQSWMARQGLLGPRQIRAATPDFVGRTTDLELVLADFDRGACIRGVSGQGGVGKTELALKLAERLGSRYRDGQIMLDLRGFDSQHPPIPRRDILAHVIHAFRPEQRLPDGDAELEGLYQTVLAGKRVLLLLDNAASAEQVHRLQPPAGCALLLTSRRLLNLPGLLRHDLDALPLADAVVLLRALAARLTETEAETLASRLGRLPQALRLAGSLLAERADVSVAEYLSRLERLRLHERTGLSEVDASIALSEQALSQAVRSTWRELSVFAGGFEKGWAAAVWAVDAETAEDRLAELRRLSLLAWDADMEFHRLHDLVRDYAATHFDLAPRERAGRRHAELCCADVCAADDEYERGGVASGLRRFDRVWSEAQAASAWVRDRIHSDAGIAELCGWLVNGCWSVRDLRQHPRNQITWLEAALSAARAGGDRRGEGAALGNLGIAYAALGQVETAIGFYEQDLVIAREIGDRRGEANACWNRGNALVKLGRVAEAIPLMEVCVAFERELGHPNAEKHATTIEELRRRLTTATDGKQ